MRPQTLSWLIAVIVTSLVPAAAAHAADSVEFSRDVLPILASNCFQCHGPDKERRKGELRLDVEQSAKQIRDGHAAIVPGKPTASELFKRIVSNDADSKMPPPDSRKTLTPEQIEILKKWIEAGAKYDRHWAFTAPKRTTAKAIPNDAWAKNEIDDFVLKRLREGGMKPQSTADRYTLIRRLSLDLIGLPPTVAEANAFVNDKSPNAVEKVVDRLLKSERFGEHWARMWLDLARYADTKGYEKDQPRNIWPYRDWVIDAFNRDMPFDQFTIEQLAGDLLPKATTDQVLATAFHRNTMTNDEGGTDNEEFRIAAVKDRIETTMQVWMGMTMRCANCHSHKYDPISQREYYAFYDVFNQTEDTDRGDDAPRAATPTSRQQAAIDAFQTQIDSLRAESGIGSADFVAARRKWEATLSSDSLWTNLKPSVAKAAGKAKLTVLNDASVLASGPTDERDVYEFSASIEKQRITAIRLAALTHSSLKRNGPGRNGADPNFVVSEFDVWLADADGNESKLKLKSARSDYSQPKWPAAAAIDGNEKTGWAVSPKFSEPHVVIFDLAEPIETAGGKLRVRISQQYGNRLVLGRFRVSVSSTAPELLKPIVSEAVDLAAIPEAKRTPQQQQLLNDAFVRVWPKSKDMFARIAKLDEQRAAIKPNPTPVMKELAANRRRVSHIHIRGNFLQKGDKINAGVPAVFGSLSPDGEQDRLAVARWLVSRENPLTARVIANRFWAKFFGIGLVETEGDFGTQGAQPSHPELLDWLAVHFRDNLKWSMKSLCRTIVLSAAYQQSSVVDPKTVDLDPRNRLLSRAPRFRLSAETVRDQSLAIAGLLSHKIGGPSVMPPQPPGIWKATYSSIKWSTSTGEDRFRRGLYTFWRRTSPYPSMLTFDAGSREVCVIRRVRTNTPLQALVTLNDPVFVEAAGALGKNSMKAAGDDQAKLSAAFRQTLIRHPARAELDAMHELLASTRKQWGGDVAQAKELIEVARMDVPTKDADAEVIELAAWIVVGNVLLNLDETLMRN
ncbi:MAG: DUF1553 domain-containing protein [Planctomycetota bacterium]|nr:DUF1553 domain-containing protein [Planctomycetota bacterium]